MAITGQGSIIYLGAGSPTVYTAIEQVVTIAGPQQSQNLIDSSHLSSTSKEYILGLADGGTIQLTCNFVGGALSNQIALKTALDNGSSALEFKIKTPTAPGASTYHQFVFRAVVNQWQLNLPTDGKAELTVGLQLTGGNPVYSVV